MSEVLVPESASPTPTAPALPEPINQAPPVAAIPATPQAPASGVPQVEPSWLKGRLDETRASTERRLQAEFERREAVYKQQIDQNQARIRALVGVDPPPNPEIQNVRNQFGQLYPGLSKMEQRAEDILKVLERSGDLESQNDHYWQSYGRQTMDRLFTHAQESLGAPLTDEGKRQLHAAFVGYVQSSPDTTARYANDPTLVQEFWKQFTSSFIDPVRRTASAQVASRVPGALPQDSPSGAPRAAMPPGLKSMDERADAAWAIYQQNAKP